MKLPKYYSKLFEDIYIHLYNKFQDNQIHCFLCGSNDMKFRNILSNKLKNRNIKVIYAENLFEAIVYSRSKTNHLDLEQILASNVELILIVLEGPGALVELGMFSNDSSNINKLIVLMDDKHKDAESFINYGPVKKLKELDEIKRVFYYESVEGIKNEMNSYQFRKLNESLEKFKFKPMDTSKKQILNIISLYYFLKIVLFIYNPIDLKELNILLKDLCIKEKIEFTEEEISYKIDSVIYWLQKENYIKKIEDEEYKLTEEGVFDIQNELYKMFGTKVIDNYRVQALNYQLRIKDKIS